MSSSSHSSAPLNRWKSRFWVLTKPMFWMSSFVLVLAGLLIADYYRVSISADELDTASILEPQTAISDIPLSADPELRELRDWEIAENAITTTVDPNLEAIAPEAIDPATSNSNVPTDDDSSNALGVNGEGFAIDGDQLSLDLGIIATDNANASRQRDRQDSSIFSDYVTGADEILQRMGLTSSPTPPVADLPTLPTSPDLSAPSSNNLGLAGTPSTPQSSSLRDAIQNLSRESTTTLDTAPSNPDTPDATPLEQSLEALPPSLLLNGQDSTASNGETTPSLGIQTAPLPGTTGYTPPAGFSHLNSGPTNPGTVPSNSVISVPSIPNTAVPVPPGGIPSTNFLLDPSVAPAQTSIQPTFTTPGQTTQSVPSPVFPPTVQPEEHVPYTGGGRDGRINTFANP
ncbi:MAG: hypothetical protein F6K30_12205 [Cyanothece sp. SIO2G6]|nr:hypothetical protein [Cyanothece sp. SIO2G6]